MIDQLEELKKEFKHTNQSRLSKLLAKLSRSRFKDAGSLIRLHECLVFMLAYPQNRKLLNQAKALLASFPKRIKYLEKIEPDLRAFDTPEVSGIAGTSLTVMLGYKFAQWLSERHPREINIDWDGYTEEERIGATLPRLLPLFEEEALVEPHLAYLDYIQVAKPKGGTVPGWLMDNFSRLALGEKQKAELYESLKLYIQFTPGFNSSRSGLKQDVPAVFYHRQPLITRRDILLEKELAAAALKIKKLTSQEGRKVLDIIRTASVLRYRELHGFIWADDKSFLKIDIGRGVIVYLNEVLPENRLPLRAYHSGFMFKNGIPLGYVESISLFEKMEIGFNLYYTFRDGETAWLYAQLLRIFKQHLGVTVFSVDPYQVGHENEEGIASGAFWFYRKMGFQPVRNEVIKIVEGEEKKISTNKNYRTPATILRKIAKSHLLYQFPSAKTSANQWNGFQLGNILIAIQQKMSRRFNGNAARMREVTRQELARLLDIDWRKLGETKPDAFSNFAILLSLIPGVSKWTPKEKNNMVEIIFAKAKNSEAVYLQLMQKHKRLKEALIRIGHGG